MVRILGGEGLASLSSSLRVPGIRALSTASSPRSLTCKEPATESAYLEGQEDLASRLITSITHIIVTLIIPLANLLTKSP